MAAQVSAGRFSRTSSGLVRQVSTLDTLYYSLCQVAIQFFFLIIAFWTFYPGSSMELATVLIMVGTLFLGIVYALFSVVYPRSGGEYVFISRSVHPAVGFAVSFAQTFWQAFFVGAVPYLLCSNVLAPFFAALGVQTNNQALTNLSTWLSGGIGMFLVGGLSIVVVCYLVYSGMRVYFLLQRWLFVAAFVSLALTILFLVLGATGVINFQANFDGVTQAGAYQKALENAAKAGVVLHPAFSFSSTTAFSIWPAESLLFAVLAVSFAGEVRNPLRAQTVGILGGIVISTVILVALELGSRLAFGDDFLRAATGLTLGGQAGQWPLPNAFVPLFTAILAGNPVFSTLVNFWFFIFQIFTLGAATIYASRAMLAWSIDGLAPEALSRVSDRYHSPTWAIVAAGVVGFVILYLWSFTTVLAVLSAVIGQSVVFLVVCLAGVVFPYWRKALAESTPARVKIAGVPLMTVAGVVGAAFIIFIISRLLVDNVAGANSQFSIYLNTGVYVVAVVWFYGVRWYRRRQGRNLDLLFKEMPVE